MYVFGVHPPKKETDMNFTEAKRFEVLGYLNSEAFKEDNEVRKGMLFLFAHQISQCMAIGDPELIGELINISLYFSKSIFLGHLIKCGVVTYIKEDKSANLGCGIRFYTIGIMGGLYCNIVANGHEVQLIENLIKSTENKKGK